MCALEEGGRQDPSLQPDHRGAGQGRPLWHLLDLLLLSTMCGQKLKSSQRSSVEGPVGVSRLGHVAQAAAH